MSDCNCRVVGIDLKWVFQVGHPSVLVNQVYTANKKKKYLSEGISYSNF
jgi:hypothetical protein